MLKLTCIALTLLAGASAGPDIKAIYYMGDGTCSGTGTPIEFKGGECTGEIRGKLRFSVSHLPIYRPPNCLPRPLPLWPYRRVLQLLWHLLH